MKNKNITLKVSMVSVLVLALLISVSIAACADTITNITIDSSKSGFISRYNIDKSFNSLRSDSWQLSYFNIDGKMSYTGSAQYEWFDISGIPNDATIISATLYKYSSKNANLGDDINAKMNPKVLPDAHRITLAKLSERFSSDDTYRNSGMRYKRQVILDKASAVSPNNNVLEFDVTDIVQGWLDGEANYGFSFLGNYNKYLSSATYYFSNSAYKPKLEIIYSIPEQSICGNSIVETGELCDSDTALCTVDGYKGKKQCNTDCLGYSSCVTDEYCGDEIKNGNELCDSETQECTTLEGYAGTQQCAAGCMQYSICSSTLYCGDNIVNGNEVCDDGILNGNMGYCNAACTGMMSNTTYPVCGNSIIESGELCDSDTQSCTVKGYIGIKQCTTDCQGYSSCITEEYCGDNTINGNEVCDEGELNGMQNHCNLECKGIVSSVLIDYCQYAKSAVATSENLAGSLAEHAKGAPDAPLPGCEVWSGYGYSWTPARWDIKANLTLTYEVPVRSNNITVFGDYQMCWSKAWLKNSKTGETVQIISGPNYNCTFVKDTQEFLADTIILETCGTSWTSTDAVQICGKANPSDIPVDFNDTVKICTWKGCKKGAVSVSIDDGFTSCMDKLSSHGYSGTFFLSDTGSYSESTWQAWNTAFNNGFELGTHTQGHLCSQVSDAEYIADMQANINDIVSHTDAAQSDIVSHAHACGYVDPNIVAILKNNWNFLSARGYNYNMLEDASPRNFFDLKSDNSHGYPGGTLEPPNYLAHIDEAVAQGKWINLVFHNECSDDDAIDYLPGKKVWVDNIGNIVKYIRLRDSASISDYSNAATELTFFCENRLSPA